MGYRTVTERSLEEIDPADWDRLVHGPGSTPMTHGFLRALERTGCVGPGTGWSSAPIVVEHEGAIVGAAAGWFKDHSMGEFVYDWSWAAAAERLGSGWYPKLIVASPFTPVTGARLLTGPATGGEAREAVASALLGAVEARAREAGCCGAHLLFCTEQEAELARGHGWLVVPQIQHHFLNAGYGTFDDWLATLRSKRRRNIRRERRRIAEDGWQVRIRRGHEVDEMGRARMHEWYARTVDQFMWGRRYLNRAFFDVLIGELGDRVLVVEASRDNAPPMAGALALCDAHGIQGRYWGSEESVDLLHFEVCYHALVEEGIRRGVTVVEFGHGGAQKALRGFTPTATWSAHLVFDPVMREVLHRHFLAVEEEVRAVVGSGPER
ncbi:MAG: GNAT family N-acetyltransferase [Deltaproteobacteria bacterium]|nr:MAG: GNAT family N-acetyltransferase [Deltaproteobacteria bacterium]